MFNETLLEKKHHAYCGYASKRHTNMSSVRFSLVFAASATKLASIERIFSNLRFVQTKLRNRLDLEKASKLVTCYREQRGFTLTGNYD